MSSTCTSWAGFAKRSARPICRISSSTALWRFLLFAGSLHVDVAELNRRKWLILILATASVIISTIVFGAGMWLAFGLIGVAIPFVWCVIFGAILAPTDAVVVENLLRKIGLPADLRAAIVGESLFNDGAGVVLFLLALGVTQGDVIHLGHGHVLLALFREIVGGAVIGVAGGWLAALLLRAVHDRGLQLLISLALVLGCYRLALQFDAVGPDRRGRGRALRRVAALSHRGQSRYPRHAGRLLVAAQSAFEHDAVSVHGPAYSRPHRHADRAAPDPVRRAAGARLAIYQRRRADRVSAREPSREIRRHAVLTWAGMRGGISIALALTLPASPWRTDLLVVTYAVVVFTIVVQGLTFTRVLHAAYGGEKVV